MSFGFAFEFIFAYTFTIDPTNYCSVKMLTLPFALLRSQNLSYSQQKKLFFIKPSIYGGEYALQFLCQWLLGGIVIFDVASREHTVEA